MSILKDLQSSIVKSKQTFNKMVFYTAKAGSEAYQGAKGYINEQRAKPVAGKYDPSRKVPLGNFLGKPVSVTQEQVKNTIQDTIRATPRALARLSLTAQEGEGSVTPNTPTTRFLFGDKPITSVQQGTKEGSKFLQERGLNKNLSGPLAFAGVVGGTILDLPGGGKSKIVKELGKEGLERLAEEFGEKAVKKLIEGKGDDVIKKVAQELIESKSVKMFHPEDAGVLDVAVDTIRSTKKVSDEVLNEAKETIDTLAGNYLKKPQIDEIVKKTSDKSNDAFYKEVSKELQKVAGDVTPDYKFATGELSSPKAADSVEDVLRPADRMQTVPAGGLPTEDPIKKVIAALEGAKPLRGKQEALYTAERARRIKGVVSAGEDIGGESGYFAQLKELKGEMPKVTFEGIRKQVSQTEVDGLFDVVQKSGKLTDFEKVAAKTGLSKLLGAEGGSVPTNSELKLLNDVFPPEFVKAVLDKRPLMEKLFSNVGSALNLPRAMMATADLSAPLRQGAFLVGRPKQWGPAFKDMFKYAGSEKAYDGLQRSIELRPTYKLMRENKLALTDLSPVLENREEAFMSNIAEKIPGFGKLSKASNRAYSGFLNKLRADTFDDLYKTAKSQGLLEGNDKLAADIAKFVNSATGRGDLGALNKNAVLLNNVFFSPKLIASRLNLLNPKYYADLDPFVRKEALKSLFTFAGTGLSVLGLAKLGGAEVGTDPTSPDFGKIKVGDTRYDIWGGFQQYLVLASRLISGKMTSSTTGREYTYGEGYKPANRLDSVQKFFESKESPVASFVTGLLRGQNALGEKFNPPAEVINRLVPLMVQDMQNLAEEWGPAGPLMGVPGIFGVGSQTYSDQIPVRGTAASGKPNIQWRGKPSFGESVINKVTGNEVTTFTPEQIKTLLAVRTAKTKREIEIEKRKKNTKAKPKTTYEDYFPK